MTEREAIFHTIVSAYLSMIAGAIEAVMSIISGHEEISMSMYGIALMAIVDFAGSILVLQLWQCRGNGEERLIEERINECNYSMTIGVLMMSLGMFLTTDSITKLSEREEPTGERSMLGISVSCFGAICGLGLAFYKYACGKALDSPVVIADSMSSLCSGLTSLTAILVILVDNGVWWSDSTAGLATALYTLFSGASTTYASRNEKNQLIAAVAGGSVGRRLTTQQIQKLLKHQRQREHADTYEPNEDISEKLFQAVNTEQRRSSWSRWIAMKVSSPFGRRHEYETLPNQDTDDDDVTFSA